MDELIKQFKQFPGIGPRQAKRFAHFLLRKETSYTNSLAENIKEARSAVHECKRCRRLFFQAEKDICDICNSNHRDASILLVIEEDSDLDNIEDKNIYDGLYFVLGGNLPVVAENPNEQIRIKALFNRVQSAAKESLEEVIIATSANPEGENTARFIKNKLRPLQDKYNIAVSTLGRGLSTGTELEYVDESTMKNALKNRG